MEEIYTEIVIDAPPEAVWAVLTDFERYPEWNPAMDVVGVGDVGERFEVTISLPRRKPRSFRPELVVVDEPRELRWRGWLVVPFLYAGEHRLELTPTDDGERTHLINAQTFEGLLVGVINGRVGGDLRAGFRRMNEALKERVEEGQTKKRPA